MEMSEAPLVNNFSLNSQDLKTNVSEELAC